MLFDLDRLKTRVVRGFSETPFRYFQQKIQGSPVSPQSPALKPEDSKKDTSKTDDDSPKQRPISNRLPSGPKPRSVAGNKRESEERDAASSEKRDTALQKKQEQADRFAALPQDLSTTLRSASQSPTFKAPGTIASLQNTALLQAPVVQDQPKSGFGLGVQGEATNPFNRPESTHPGFNLANINRFVGVSEHGGYLPNRSWAQLPAASSKLATSAAPLFSPEAPFSQFTENTLGRFSQPQPLFQLFQQAAEKAVFLPPGVDDPFLETVVSLQGRFLFLKDENQKRIFRLSEEQQLFEMGEEHGDQPLSMRAKAEMVRILKERGIQPKLNQEGELSIEQHHEMERAKQGQKEGTGRSGLRSLLHEGSSFAELLREVLEEGGNVAAYLSEGEDPQFAPKTDWNGWVGNMLQNRCAEKSVSKNWSKLFDLLFLRGCFLKGDEQIATLVADFKYEENGKTKEEKFAQIPLHPELKQLLAELKPGQAFPKDLLKRFLGGEELVYLQMAHVVDLPQEQQMSEMFKGVQFDFSAEFDPYSQARLEHRLFRGNKPIGSEAGEGSSIGDALILAPPPKQSFLKSFFQSPRWSSSLVYVFLILGILLGIYLLIWK